MGVAASCCSAAWALGTRRALPAVNRASARCGTARCAGSAGAGDPLPPRPHAPYPAARRPRRRSGQTLPGCARRRNDELNALPIIVTARCAACPSPSAARRRRIRCCPGAGSSRTRGDAGRPRHRDSVASVAGVAGCAVAADRARGQRPRSGRVARDVHRVPRCLPVSRGVGYVGELVGFGATPQGEVKGGVGIRHACRANILSPPRPSTSRRSQRLARRETHGRIDAVALLLPGCNVHDNVRCMHDIES